MIEFTVKFELDAAFMERFASHVTEALEMAGSLLYSDLVLSQTVPFDTGTLQNVFTYVDYDAAKEGKIRLISKGPYARRLYFNPQYNFRRDKNLHAGGRWFDPYLAGHAKGQYIPKAFALALRQRIGGDA